MRKKTFVVLLVLILAFSTTVVVAAGINPWTRQSAEVTDILQLNPEMADILLEMGVVIPSDIPVYHHFNYVMPGEQAVPFVPQGRILDIEELRSQNQAVRTAAFDASANWDIRSGGYVNEAKLESFADQTGLYIGDLADVPVFSVYLTEDEYDLFMESFLLNVISMDDARAAGLLDNVRIAGNNTDLQPNNLQCILFGCPGTQLVLEGFLTVHNISWPFGNHFDCTVWAVFSERCIRCNASFGSVAIFWGMANC